MHTWAAVNFTTKWNLQDLVQRLIRCGGNKGIVGLCFYLILYNS